MNNSDLPTSNSLKYEGITTLRYLSISNYKIGIINKSLYYNSILLSKNPSTKLQFAYLLI